MIITDYCINFDKIVADEVFKTFPYCIYLGNINIELMQYDIFIEMFYLGSKLELHLSFDLSNTSADTIVTVILNKIEELKEKEYYEKFNERR